jgi:hypothetical protein
LGKESHSTCIVDIHSSIGGELSGVSREEAKRRKKEGLYTPHVQSGRHMTVLELSFWREDLQVFIMRDGG